MFKAMVPVKIKVNHSCKTIDIDFSVSCKLQAIFPIFDIWLSKAILFIVSIHQMTFLTCIYEQRWTFLRKTVIWSWLIGISYYPISFLDNHKHSWSWPWLRTRVLRRDLEAEWNQLSCHLFQKFPKCRRYSKVTERGLKLFFHLPIWCALGFAVFEIWCQIR